MLRIQSKNIKNKTEILLKYEYLRSAPSKKKGKKGDF